MFGGVGTLPGHLSGRCLGVVRNGLIHGYECLSIDLIIGAVLISAVWFSTFSTREGVKG